MSLTMRLVGTLPAGRLTGKLLSVAMLCLSEDRQSTWLEQYESTAHLMLLYPIAAFSVQLDGEGGVQNMLRRVIHLQRLPYQYHLRLFFVYILCRPL